MSLFTAATVAAYEYRAGNALPLYALKRRKSQKQRGFRAKSTYGHCIKDKVLLDPACGTGGFLFESYRTLLSNASDEQRDEIRTWAHHNLYGVDLDPINVKLSRALMIGAKDGSTNIVLGDSLREQKWGEFPMLPPVIGSEADGSYDVVLTNPPFGEKLKIRTTDAKRAKYTICKHTNGGANSEQYADTELGLVFMERAYRLLAEGGRLGIVLPETYFFSTS